MHEDTKQEVYYSKFHPIGRRTIDGGNADGKFTGTLCSLSANVIALADYFKEIAVRGSNKDAVLL